MDFSGSLKLEHAFDVRIDFKDRWVIGPLPSTGATQGYTSVLRGVVEGPRLNGKVVEQSGSDWPFVRPDGVVELNAHYMLEADDGTRIYIANRGYVYGARPAKDGQPARPAYFRCTPSFRVPDGPHEWLARTVIIGAGERHPDPAGDYSIFRYWAVL
jgi:hypothetical protein